MMTYVGYALLGLTTGFLSVLLGIGGGIAFVPIAIFFFSLPFKEARAASLAFIVPIALLGAFSYRAQINTKLLTLVALALPFGIIGVQLGGRLGRSLSGPALNRIFGALMLIVGLKMILLPGDWEGLFKGPQTAAVQDRPAPTAEAGPSETARGH